MIVNRFADLTDSSNENTSILGQSTTYIPDEVSGAEKIVHSLNELQTNQNYTLNDIVSKLIQVKIEVEGDLSLIYKFPSIKDYNEDKYKIFLNDRLICFKYFKDNDVVHAISDLISTIEPLEITPLIENCINNEKHDQTYIATLFLLCMIVKLRPDLITPKTFNIENEKFLESMPLITWIISCSLQSDKIAHLDPLVSHQIIDIFLNNSILSKDSKYDDVAICAAHLIAQSYYKQNVYRITSSHFAQLTEISLRQTTPRDCYVANVLLTTMRSLSVSDKKLLAAQLLEVFPDTHLSVIDIFKYEATRKTSATFVDGWVEAHATHREASMKYLCAVAGQVPERIICKFPKKDLRNGSNIVRLALVNVELKNTSTRVCTICFFLLIIYWFYKKHQ
ncbi:hypothetical protein TVAG_122430 [Trichomonas vaginalis G3]|uniref:Uncharacterized protein n=1 Tax=Trichomonas vaginalis (strain ATCC PRA-98 / G3) TaxID=412133 RepID=A2DN00_TRIV3|nr:hypothetical protein TVAGG3_1010530 [Trichomonas vaginalis G3]EAY18177.1 hypothetical protein TVAG_122430 [Trichomonas vaginalis G3]KAI5491473.1 hypothetical protein TVAGG3_1010530 [Trichomonas vaginalis G3]|eukprot:XP_001579163.1 hypothetical protein [Trichomonas vaginalis G3]